MARKEKGSIERILMIKQMNETNSTVLENGRGVLE
jgi:hypothetical protein